MYTDFDRVIKWIQEERHKEEERNETMGSYADALKDVLWVIMNPDEERTYIVTEWCQHCESEIEMVWDTDTRGFEAFCPVCGERLMLCDECVHAGDGGCDYNSSTGCCKHRSKQHGEAKEVGGRLYTTTWCPHCETDVEATWDVDARGVRAFCPLCGERLTDEDEEDEDYEDQ